MAGIDISAATFALVKLPSSLISSPQQKLASPLAQGLSSPCMRHRRALSCSSRTKPLLAVSGGTSVAAVNSPSEKRTGSRIAVIDNYDSFTYNLCQYMGELGCEFEVYRNDEINVDELRRKNPRGILISPGPGAPQDSGISLQTVLEFGPSVPLFGVCMGLQCIGEAFGGKIVRSPNGVMHGKTSPVYYSKGGEHNLFEGLPNPFVACRYHSLVIEKESFPGDALEATAWTEDGLIMGVRHREHKHLQGVQFHPESIITDQGKTIVQNFVKMIESMEAEAAAAAQVE
ncbi:anthranilate synthase beta subunit 2, chloroplastic-like [Andrographis paniculata]|uniref:anthranilate synthase beta subunit 2, chloroplastic-like n=1 Tax=Andrographis paniculata TaxID=175694 RepID=UPI0021E84C0D|nr:anthranilate synthase beta subunit 2, chloroplastic-like [Andrographis paniculata]